MTNPKSEVTLWITPDIVCVCVCFQMSKRRKVDVIPQTENIRVDTETDRPTSRCVPWTCVKNMSMSIDCGHQIQVYSGCLQLLEILEIYWNLISLLEILEIYWNLISLLEILEISWNVIGPPGKLRNVCGKAGIHAVLVLSLIHIWRCRRIERCRSRWSPYH